MGEVWRDTLLYNKWANLGLLDQCSKLSDQQLQLTAPGTYGSIAATWMHLLAAEQRYLRRLTGADPTLSEKHDFPGIAELKEHARRSGDALLAAVAAHKSDGTTPIDYDSEMVGLPRSLIVVQAIHHANDHRTHICTILGSHSIPFEDVDVWSYGLALHRAGALQC